LIAAALVAAVLASRTARGAFVVVDVAYTHSAQTTKDSHYRVPPPPGTPSNWTSPIDYVGGSAWVRLEVKTKAGGDTPTRFQVCFELAVNYACTNMSPVYTKPGVYTWGTSFSGAYPAAFYLSGPVDWSKGIQATALILKDTKNVKPAPENVGAAVSALYMPTDLHVTVTLVPKGETYVEPMGGDAGSGDAGSNDGASDSATPTSDDAATWPEAAAQPAAAPPGSDATSGAPDVGAPAAPTMTAADHDAGSTASPTGLASGRNTASGCTYSPVPSGSNVAPTWVLAILWLTVARRRR